MAVLISNSRKKKERRKVVLDFLQGIASAPERSYDSFLETPALESLSAKKEKPENPTGSYECTTGAGVRMPLRCYLRIRGWRWLCNNMTFHSFWDTENILCRVLISRGK